MNAASPRIPATRPAIADAPPRSTPFDARMRRRERAPDQIAKGAKMPNGRLSRPRTNARVAARSLMRARVPRRSPEGAVAQEEVKDGADPPDEGDDDPHDLLHAAHVGAPDDVDDAKDPGNRMQKDRQQDLDQKLHDRIACGTRDKKRGAGLSTRASQRT